jgi:hypothetical protein
MRARDSERDLLLLVARAASPQRDVALTETLHCPLDWERLLDLAYLHGCVQILAAAMSVPHRREAVPAPIARDLTALNAALSLRRHLQLRALTQALDALAAQSIQPVLLKGLALAASLYPDPELRPCQDLDLLVRSPAEARAAGVAFRQLGYVHCEPEPGEVPGFHTVYAAPAQSLTVELHTDPLQLGLPMRTASAVWRTRETVEITGRQVCVLGLEYQILHLCVHLHTHGYGRLIWLKDLDLLLRTRGAGADWDRVWALAATEGVTISVRHALPVVSALLDTGHPWRGGTRNAVATTSGAGITWQAASALGSIQSPPGTDGRPSEFAGHGTPWRQAAHMAMAGDRRFGRRHGACDRINFWCVV